MYVGTSTVFAVREEVSSSKVLRCERGGCKIACCALFVERACGLMIPDRCHLGELQKYIYMLKISMAPLVKKKLRAKQK